MRFDLDMPAWKWPFYVARHPFEGFEDLRWKKAYNTKVSMVIVLCFFLITVCQQVMTGLPVQHELRQDIQHSTASRSDNYPVLYMGNR